MSRTTGHSGLSTDKVLTFSFNLEYGAPQFPEARLASTDRLILHIRESRPL